MQVGPGVRIGSFEIGARIGAGGMGTVYRARDTRLGREVAIKVLQERLAGQHEYLLRFQREARSASALNHPNIVTLFEIDEVDGAPFVAMELIDGTPLRVVMQGGPLPPRKLLKLAAQIADGLAAAHDAGIVHRDLKPENVMITAQGVVKILDFGLARVARSADPDDTTGEIITSEHNRIMGTAAYMSPEQASGGPVDFRSDQFSFGSMLYEMATCKAPFRRATSGATLEAIIDDDIAPLQTVNPKLPPQFCWIVERCLAKEPGDRYASTRDLARELQTLRDRLPATDTGERALPLLTHKSVRAAAATIVVGIVVIALSNLPRSLRTTATPSMPAKRYLAVLPFTDTSAEPDRQMFSHGFAQAVSARLAQAPSLQVIPPASASAVLSRKADDREIAQELGATMLLKATLRRVGDSLQVSYAITDTARGTTIVSEHLSVPAENVWAAQDEVADDVARHLGVQLASAPTPDSELDAPEEQDLYLRALGHLQNPEDPQAIEAALGLLRELLETASGSPLVHAALARGYLYKYQINKDRTFSDKAILAAERARALRPDSPEVLFALGSVQQYTGRYSDAIATLKHVLVLQPNSPEAVIALAKCYQGAVQFDDAARTFKRGIDLRPTWWFGYNELGVMYLAAGQYADAAAQFRRVIELNPKSAWGYSNLGAVQVYTQHLPEAIDSLNRALALRESAAALSNLAYCYYYTANYAKSAEASRRAAALKPKLATHWMNLADACRWTTCSGEVDSSIAKATELLKQELSVNPQNSRVHAALAICLARTGHAREAREHVREAIALEPKNPTRMLQAARVANFLGDSDESISWLKRAFAAGQSEMEVQRDPEFRSLRESDSYRKAFRRSDQPT